jgi:UPF0755 protein
MATKSTSVKLTLKITSFVLRLLLNIMFYVLVVILVVNFSRIAYEFTYELYGPVTVDNDTNARKIYIQIEQGESSMDIASKLELNLAIRNKYSFWLKTKLENMKIMPGTYEIYSNMTYDEILDVITDYSASIIEEGSDSETGDAADTAAGSAENSEGNAGNNTEDGTDSLKAAGNNGDNTGNDAK